MLKATGAKTFCVYSGVVHVAVRW